VRILNGGIKTDMEFILDNLDNPDVVLYDDSMAKLANRYDTPMSTGVNP